MQSSAVLSKMDCRGFLRNPAMTEDDGQIRWHCETCNARRSNPVRFLEKWIAAVSCETWQWQQPKNKSDVCARLATQGEAIQCGSLQNGLPRFLAKPRNDGSEELIRCHETCNARRSNPVRFLSKWIAAVSCETSQ